MVDLAIEELKSRCQTLVIPRKKSLANQLDQYEEDDSEDECEECPQLAPLYLATFSDMAILLMAFFVMLLAYAIFSPTKYEQIVERSNSVEGVQREVEAFESPTAENMVLQQFRSAPVDPVVYQIVEEDRTDEVQPEDDVDTEIEPEKFENNALEIVEMRLAQEISQGKVEVREEDSRIVVEVNDSFGDGFQDVNDKAKLKGEISAELLEVYLQVATAQAETGATIEVLGGTPPVNRAEESLDADDTPKVYRDLVVALSEEIQSGRVEVRRDGTDVIISLPSSDGFNSGSATLRPNFLASLDQIGDALIPIQRIARIEGHTDDVDLMFGGRFRDNWDLSSARASSVADYLLDQMFRLPGELYVVGMGGQVPIQSNDTPQGRAANRRIEIILPKG